MSDGSTAENDAPRPANHNHGPTAQLLDPVYCLTCQWEHVATIPAVTFACASCGFGSWGHSVAAAHADSQPAHIVYPRHHATTCVLPPERQEP